MNRLIKLVMVSIWLFFTGAALANPDNLHLYGTLVEEPCTIKPGNEKIPLLFGNVPDKNLYAYGRTVSKEFTINLSDCDINIGQSVRVLFTGVPSIVLPGYLAIIGSSAASGFAIGIENENGTLLEIDKEGKRIELQNGTTQLHFKTFLKGEPDAITNMNIKRGSFTAVATFKLDYE